MNLEEAQVTPRDWTAHPPFIHPAYRSTVLRGPKRPLIPTPQTLSELTGPVYGHSDLGPLDNDLTKNGAVNGEPLGERIVVAGQVTDETGRPVRNTLIEVWQANAAGRYIHKRDQHPAPLDPNFFGAGRCVTDDNGMYRFMSIKPGPYPWANHHNAWRPAHIHFSLFGPTFLSRLVTQMYFPGDPLLPFDPIYNGIPDEKARPRLISKFSLDLTQPDFCTGFRFDICLRGRAATPTENK
jgi:protocatechuate 3,4-dioxygenase beta subunit